MLNFKKTYVMMAVLFFAAVIIGGCGEAQAPTAPRTPPVAVMSLTPSVSDFNFARGDDNGAGDDIVCGDIDGDGIVHLWDVIHLYCFIYENGPAPIMPETGDVNGDCDVNILDLGYLLKYICRAGQPPVCLWDRNCDAPES